MTTYVYDPETGEVVEKKEREISRHHNIMSDIQPYQSMIDGRIITSRSHHRTHLREHNCIEVGNEKMETKLAKPDRTARRKAITQMVNERLTDRDANRILSQLRNK